MQLTTKLYVEELPIPNLKNIPKFIELLINSDLGKVLKCADGKF